MDLTARPFLPAAERLARLPQHEWQALKNDVHDASSFHCLYCGCDASERPICDHKLPLSRGGTHDRANLATACFTCNASKGELTPEEFSAKRGSDAWRA